MVDVAWQETGVSAQDVSERARVLNKLRIGDIVFHQLTKSAALTVLVLLGGVILSLFLGAMPAFQEFGFSFIATQSWNPVTEKFGAVAPIYGTIITSLIAMLIAVPFGLMIAMFLTELCPIFLRRPIGIAIELLAGIPSIIYGIWGLFVFAPSCNRMCSRQLSQHSKMCLCFPCCLRVLLSASGSSPVLSSRSWSCHSSPRSRATCSMQFRRCSRKRPMDLAGPNGKSGVTSFCPTRASASSAASCWVLGRALGETMAVTFVIGNAHKISASLLAPGTTISATIANEFTEAVGDLYTSSLIALGLILFVITFIVLAIARYLLLRIERRIG